MRLSCSLALAFVRRPTGKRSCPGLVMPQRCAAVGCTNASNKLPKVRFFCFPAASLHAAKRKKWIQAMRRMNVDGSTWTPTANSRVCSEHFISGKVLCLMAFTLRKRCAVLTIAAFCSDAFPMLFHFELRHISGIGCLIRVAYSR